MSQSLTKHIGVLCERGLTYAEIAQRLKIPRHTVSSLAWVCRNRERKRANENQRRWRKGIRTPMVKFRGEQKKLTEQRLRDLRPLLARGLSTREAAHRLGLTVGTVAGMLYREHRRKPRVAA